jgi:hypothetical protein
MYSQKAILKIAPAKNQVLFEIFNSQNLKKKGKFARFFYMIQVRSQKY